jgi:hypothetical protein
MAKTKAGKNPTGFIQVMRGPVTDRDELRTMLDRWMEQQAPSAKGWLGTTSGVDDGGNFVALVRFATPEDARRNSDRSAQHQWWMETSKIFSGDVVFHDCVETDTIRGGGSDDAGFVQIIEGRVSNTELMRDLSRQLDAIDDDGRADLLGGNVALHGDGGFTMAAYFTDEASARRGEQSEPPPAVKSLLEQQAALMSDLTYTDLRQPWLHSPR